MYTFDFLFARLDELSWGFRFDKWEERDSAAVYHLYYVDPKTLIWHNKALTVRKKVFLKAIQHLVSPDSDIDPPRLASTSQTPARPASPSALP